MTSDCERQQVNKWSRQIRDSRIVNVGWENKVGPPHRVKFRVTTVSANPSSKKKKKKKQKNREKDVSNNARI